MRIKRKIRHSYYRFRRVILDNRYLPRWAVMLIDVGICVFSYFIAWIIIRDIPLQFYSVFPLYQKVFLVIGIHFLFFKIFRTYSGIIRHSTFTDVYKIALATAGLLITLLVSNKVYQLVTGDRIFLTTGLILYSFLSLLFLVSFRIVVKEAYRFLRAAASGNLKKRVLVYGTDNKTIALTQALINDTDSLYRPVAFLSSEDFNNSLKLNGLPVINFGRKMKNVDLGKIKERYQVEGVLLVSDLMSVPQKNQFVELIFSEGMDVFNLYLPEQWHDASDVQLRIAPLQIEDLLERNVIETDFKFVSRDLENKTILVTGGAGSIGGELVRQIACFNPKVLVVLDNAESPLYAVDVYLKKNFPQLRYKVYLADITKAGRMEGIFEKFRFDLVYHAAAYKHVPMIEKHPREGIRTNIIGTRVLAELAVRYNCERFVMVSTDKAVNPSNVMGASKRAAEMYVQAFQDQPEVSTKFMTTRFGNVLGSSGSVIPFFKEQIKNGGPVTVTHKDIIRYFMTIEEACQLVLQAGTMGNGGEIFVFDMGKPVRILDLAERMIKLSGLRPYIDIPIEITGLRDGEKLYEELLNNEETTLPTFHPKIMIGKVKKYDYDAICKAIDELDYLANSVGKKETIIKRLKELVPEYISQNSVFEELDDKDRKEAVPTVSEFIKKHISV